MPNGNIIKINGKDIKDVKATQDIADLKSQINGEEPYAHAVKANALEIISTKNLYNKATNITGKFINSSGAIIDSTNDSITDWIFLKAGNYWLTYDHGTVYGFGYIAKYDANKVFKSRPQLNSSSLTVAEDCYIRLMGYTSHLDVAMLVAGTEAPESYIPYKPLIKKEYLPEFHDLVSPVNGARIIDGTVGLEKVDFIAPSEDNQLNQMTVEVNKIISALGVISDAAGYAITDKMYLKPSTTYSYRKCYRIVYFNASGERVGSNPLEERGATGYETGTFTTNANTVYAIIALQIPAAGIYTNNWQIVEGSTLPDYVPSHLVIDGYRLYDAHKAPYNALNTIVNWTKTITDTAPVYLLDSPVGAIETGDKNVAAVYAAYDALMALYPDYITKTELGTNGDPTNPVMLYRYDFKTQAEYSTNRIAKMILISGIHPEWAGIWALYHALEKIASDPNLADIKGGLHIICVPIVNAYACNGNAARKNWNGVDLARNFEVGWGIDTNPSSETYSGPYALSEVEDQYIDQIMAANTDAIYFASCHNFQTMHPVDNVTWPNACMWGAGPSNYTVDVSGMVIAKMTAAWNHKYEYDEPNFGLAKRDALMGSEGDQGLKYGIQGLTFEVCAYFRANSETAYDSFCMSRNTEVYVNMIRTVAHCYSYRDKVHQYEA